MCSVQTDLRINSTLSTLLLVMHQRELLRLVSWTTISPHSRSLSPTLFNFVGETCYIACLCNCYTPTEISVKAIWHCRLNVSQIQQDHVVGIVQ